MQIRQLWTTPLAEFPMHISENVRQDLINVLIRKESEIDKMKEEEPDFHDFAKSKGFYSISHYNLFNESEMKKHPEEKESLLAFERSAVSSFRKFLSLAYNLEGAEDPAKVKLIGRCFGNLQRTGARTFPHYHQTCDGVLVHYLSLGDGVDEGWKESPRHGSHALLIQDPRGTPNYPYWEKLESIEPYVGLTVIHPAYCWHETNVFRMPGLRAAMVVNFQIVTNSYVELHEPFRF